MKIIFNRFFLSIYVEFYNWLVLIWYKYNCILSESSGGRSIMWLWLAWVEVDTELYWIICIYVSRHNFTTKLFIYVVLNEWLIVHYFDLFENQ